MFPSELSMYALRHITPPENKVLVARNAEFLENSLITQEQSGSLEDLEIIQEEDMHPSIDTSLNHEDDDLEINEPQSDIIPIRRSTRTRHAPDRMCLYINVKKHELGDLGEPANYKAALLDLHNNFDTLAETPHVVSTRTRHAPDRMCLYINVKKHELGDLGEPANYKAALLDLEFDKWLNAMNVEMQSMKDNEVWNLFDLPPNSKTAGSKWLFKKKTDMDGVVHTFKDLLVAKGKAEYILKIKIYKDIPRQLIGLCQSAYIEKILKRFHMENSKRRSITMQEKLRLSKSQGASTLNITSRFQQNPGDLHWTTVKNILKYLRNTKDMFLIYEGVVDWKSTKESIFTTSSAEAEYIAAYDASKEAVWVRKFISGLGVVPTIKEPINMYCDNIGAIAIANELGITKGARHFRAKVHCLRKVIEYGDIKLEKVHTYDNLSDPFTKALAFPKHSEHTRNIRMLPVSSLIQVNYFVIRVLGVVTTATALDCVVRRYYTVSRRYPTALGPALAGQRALGSTTKPTTIQLRNFPITHSISTSRFGKKRRSQENKIKRGENVEDEPVAAGRWLPVEEELLATCYVAVSEDNNVGRSQKHETFWYRVLNEFNSKKFKKRTKDMLTSKWHTLNANCQKINAAYKRAKRLGKSAEYDVDLMKQAQSIYRDEHKGVSFSPKDAWAILKFHPKWDAPKQVDLNGDVPGATQEDLFGHDARPRPARKPWPTKKTKSDATASTGGSSASTQFGELTEQVLRLKREAAEKAFEAQAEKDRTLM
nr:hypothetical protein [Tanacetum cinerariifolium]